MNRNESAPRRGFTLIEVGIALLILVVACLSVLMLLPKALQIQQESRMKILASIHVQSLVANFMGHDVDLVRQESTWTPMQGKIFPNPKNQSNWTAGWTTPELAMRESRWMQAKGEFDLERLTTQIYRGNYPVPLEIAQRLDSPGDEIRQIVSAGGYVFYTDENGGDQNLGKNQPLGKGTSDQRKLIWGVVGPPQQNLLPFNPMAYQQVEMYPHPPQARARPVDRVWHFSKNISYEFVRSYQTNTWEGWPLPNPLTVEVWRPSEALSTLQPVISCVGSLPGNIVNGELDYGMVHGNNLMLDIQTKNGFQVGFWWDAGKPWLYQRNTWEWYARVAYDMNGGSDPKWFDTDSRSTKFSGFTASNHRNTVFERLYSYSDHKSFLTSIDAFRELSNRHWLRIVAQTDEISAAISTSIPPPVSFGAITTGQWVENTVPFTDYRIKSEGGVVCRDSLGNVIYEPFTNTRIERVFIPGATIGPLGGGTIQVMEPGSLADTGVLQWKDLEGDGKFTPNKEGNCDFSPNFWVGIPQGYAQPAQGLPYSRLRGSDILYEDAVLVGPLKMLKEVYQSLPSLERRVKYRTAALILWAKVAYNLDIRHIEDPTLAYVEPESGSAPTVPANSGRDYLPRNRNPLYNWQNLDGFLTNGSPVTGNWHPTQILAINYLAHAAMMCTGYKAPFYRDKNSPGIEDDELMVEDEGAISNLPTSLNSAVLQKKWQWVSSYGSNHDELPYRSLTNSAMEEGIFDPSAKQWNLVPALGVGVEPTRSPTDARTDPRVATANVSNWYVQVLTATDAGGDRQLESLPVDPITGYLRWPHTTRRIVIGDRNKNGSLESNELYNPLATATSAVLVWDTTNHYYLRNPYCLGLLPLTQNLEHAGFPTRQESLRPNDFQTYAQPALSGFDLSNRAGEDVPIGYRPKSSDILNPFPPPYADKGAFDAGGNRVHKVTWQLVMEVIGESEGQAVLAPRLVRKIRRSEDYIASYANKDSAWARNTHEAMMRIVMHYKANFPYDNTVPLPANRQLFTDRGIWQKDLFTSAGNARRPQDLSSVSGARANAYYPLTAPVSDTTEGLRWNMAFARMASVDNPNQFGESIEWQNKWNDLTSGKRMSNMTGNYYNDNAGRYRLADRLPMLRSGDGFLFGAGEMSKKEKLTGAANVIPLPVAGDHWINGFSDQDRKWVNIAGRQSGKANDIHQPLMLNAAIAQTLKDWGYNGTTSYTATRWNDSNSPIIQNQAGGDWYSEPRSSSIPRVENSTRCTATRQFTPSQRCRQLVYWSADWMRYEDFESAPSAPIDWSMMPMYSYGSAVASSICFVPLNLLDWGRPGPDPTWGGSANDVRAGPFLRNVATTWEAIIWERLLSKGGQDLKVGDQLTLQLNGLSTIVKVSEIPAVFTSNLRPYWVKAVDPNLNFRDTIFYAACNMPAKEALLPYDTWANSTGNPTWSAGPSDAVIKAWFGSDLWWNYSGGALIPLSIWNSGIPTRTGEGGPSEYRYTWSSPYRIHTLSSLDRSDMQIFDVDIGSNKNVTAGKTYSLASKRGFLCRGVPAEPFISVAVDPWLVPFISAENSVTADAIGYNPFIMTGAFGADRNHDGVFSKGDIKRSDRLRAEFIARFNYYDPIAWICLGQ